MARPTEHSTVLAAAAVISSTQYGAPPAPLVSKVVPRWILALEVGEAIAHLTKEGVGGDLLPINAWVLSTASWVPSKVQSQSGESVVPTNFTPGFDDWNIGAGGGDRATQVQYKISVQGSLKVWQVVEYRQGTDTDNSEIDSMNQRQAVIDSFTRSPRFGLDHPDFEHDELKIPSIAVLPFGASLLHIAQGNIPFSFTYVVPAA
jgi:hypothetical protein